MTAREDAVVAGSPFIDDPNKDEVYALKAQNQMLKEFQSDLIATVYWSLALLVAAFAGLIGYNWFTSFKAFQKDKTDLKAEILADVDLKITDNNKATDNLKREALTEVDTRIASQFAIATQNFLSTGDHQEAVLELRKQIDGATKELRENLEGKVDDIQNRIKILERRYHYGLLQTRQIEEWMWEKREVYGNILVTQASALESAIKYDESYFTQSTLERIRRKIEEIFTPGSTRTVSKESKEFMSKALEKVPSDHAILVADIKEKLSAIPVTS